MTLEDTVKDYDLKKEAEEFAAYKQVSEAYKKDVTINPHAVWMNLTGNENSQEYALLAREFENHPPQHQARELAKHVSGQADIAVKVINSKPGEALSYVNNPQSLYEALSNVNPLKDASGDLEEFAKVHKQGLEAKRFIEDYEAKRVDLDAMLDNQLGRTVEAFQKAGIKDFLISSYVGYFNANREERANRMVDANRAMLKNFESAVAKYSDQAHAYLSAIYNSAQGEEKDGVAEAIGEAIGNYELHKRAEAKNKKS